MIEVMRDNVEPMYPATHLTHRDLNHIEKKQRQKKANCCIQIVHVLESELWNECIFYESLTIAQSNLSPMDPSSTNQKNLHTIESRVPPVIMLNYTNQQSYEHQEALLLKSSIAP